MVMGERRTDEGAVDGDAESLTADGLSVERGNRLDQRHAVGQGAARGERGGERFGAA